MGQGTVAMTSSGAGAVNLGRGDVGVPEDPLHVSEG